MRAVSKLTTDTALSDADLLRNVRDLFKLTLDDVVTSGISRRTWTRIEANEERKHTPAVQKRLAALQDIMHIMGRWQGPTRPRPDRHRHGLPPITAAERGRADGHVGCVGLRC
jgi:hypothetical protein